MTDCDRCAQPADGTAYVCGRCSRHLVERLHEAAALVPELVVTVARQAATGEPGRGADTHPLPLDLPAAYDVGAVRNTVTTWARHVADTRGHTLPLDRVDDVMRWLAGQVDWLRHRPEAEQAVDELLDACRLVARIVDTHGPRWYAGPCRSTDTDGDVCGQDMYAPPGADTVRCGQCGASYRARERIDWLLDEAGDRLYHAELIGRALAALGLPCTGSVIRNLADRGRITAHGTDSAGRPTYRLGDVRQVLAARPPRRSGRDTADVA